MGRNESLSGIVVLRGDKARTGDLVRALAVEARRGQQWSTLRPAAKKA